MDMKIKKSAEKVPIWSIPLRALYGCARVFQFGATKYAKGNWHNASDDALGERYVGAALRHLAAMQNADGTITLESCARRDVESTLPELDHAIASLVMLRGLLIKTGKLTTDPHDEKIPAGTKVTVEVDFNRPLCQWVEQSKLRDGTDYGTLCNRVATHGERCEKHQIQEFGEP